MNDPEHAQQVSKAQARAKAEGKLSDKPALSTWTPEMSMLAKVLDAVRFTNYLMRATNGDRQAKPPNPEPRPGTALEKADHERRKADHEKLTARLIRR